MKRLARRHPILTTLAALILGPYLLAIGLAFAVAYGIAVAFDMLLDEKR